MFDVFPKALASVASFLFPLFASYKALKTADPAELAPWLMYWVVYACVIFVEAWTEWILVWVPFYHYMRLFFLLYLVLPQTQGARILYLSHLHPWLEEHEARIDEFIGTAHERLKTESIAYLRKAIAYLRTHVLGLPPTEAEAAAASAAAPPAAYPYTQSLLARFTLPSARWPGGVDSASASGILPDAPGPVGAAANGSDYYTLLSRTLQALGTATGAAGGAAASALSGAATAAAAASSSTSSPPPAYDGTSSQDQPATYSERATFIATQRGRLRLLLAALDQEAAQLEEEEDHAEPHQRGGGDATPTSVWGTAAADAFEQIDAESGAEEDIATVRQRRRRTVSGTGQGSWSSWIWGSGGETAQASGADQSADK